MAIIPDRLVENPPASSTQKRYRNEFKPSRTLLHCHIIVVEPFVSSALPMTGQRHELVWRGILQNNLHMPIRSIVDQKFERSHACLLALVERRRLSIQRPTKVRKVQISQGKDSSPTYRNKYRPQLHPRWCKPYSAPVFPVFRFSTTSPGSHHGPCLQPNTDRDLPHI